MSKAVEAGSAYTTDPRIAATEHFTRIDAFGMMVTVRAPASNDPLGFSYERMLQGEADMKAGRVRSFADAMDALRARIRRNRA
jgi:hypothetical protein